MNTVVILSNITENAEVHFIQCLRDIVRQDKEINPKIQKIRVNLLSKSSMVKIISKGRNVMAGYIKIYRDILEWEWWSDINTYRLFTYMLLKANWQDSKFRGINIPKGSFVSTLDKLSRETSLTINEVRTAIKHLQSTNEITNKSHGKYTVFTINNYCLYQDDNKQITEKTQEENKEVTNRSQPVNNLLTTIKEYKEDKEEKKDNITVSLDTVRPTDVRLIADTWNGLKTYGIKPISKINNGTKRYTQLTARIRQYGTETVLTAIDKIKDSSFLQGKNKKGWMITFDWFILPTNFPKVLEGNYDNSITANNIGKKSSNQFDQMMQQDYDINQIEEMLTE